MIDEKVIDNIDDILRITVDQPLDKSNGRNRGYYLYRGLPDATFELKTSLQRNCGKLSGQLEEKILNNFAKYTAIEDSIEEMSVWRSMILGQHHGLPTRLLDWTHSPFVGLHFAVSVGDYSKLDEKDCVLWRIDISKIHEKLPKEFQNVMDEKGAKVFSVDMLNSVSSSLKEYDRLTNGESMVIMEPPSIDPRIVNQYAFFSVIPGQVDNIESFLDKYTEGTTKYVISKDLKWRIRDFLDEANISERTIYPGLDGICSWLARHYYYKETKDDKTC